MTAQVEERPGADADEPQCSADGRHGPWLDGHCAGCGVSRYGAPQPEEVRQTVTIREPVKFGKEVEVPIPGELAKQRRQLNALARGESAAAVDREQFERLRSLVRRGT